MPDVATSSASPVLAPGARVVIRDAEWVIRRVDRSPDGGYQIVCDGVSELVREREAIFLTTLTRLDSIGIQRVRSRIPTSHNPFHYYDKAIISIDTLKQDAEYRTYLEQAYWDIIVIDEAHNVADRGAGGAKTGASHGRTSLRSRLARLLARRSDTLVMLSATPHDGRARSFASLMNMLDAPAIADPDNYSKEDFRDKGLVIRRFKKDIRSQVRNAFRDREIVRRRFPASTAEEAAYEALLAVRVAPSRSAAPGKGLKRRDLFLVTLEKALFSSPAACMASVKKRIRRRERELSESPNPHAAAEVESLQALRQALAALGPGRLRQVPGAARGDPRREAVRLERARPDGSPGRVRGEHRNAEVAARSAREGPAAPRQPGRESSTAA